MDTPTVFVLGNDLVCEEAISSLVESVGLAAERYATGQAFVESVSSSRPGCLVLEVRLPDMSGLELFQGMRASGFSLPAIFLTAYAEVLIAVEAMQVGAFDFIEKPFSAQKLLDRIQQAVAQDRIIKRERAARQTVSKRIEALSVRERQVMDLVVAGLPNKAIAASLQVSSKTVEVHRSNMMQKLHAASLAEVVRSALRVGLEPKQECRRLEMSHAPNRKALTGAMHA